MELITNLYFKITGVFSAFSIFFFSVIPASFVLLGGAIIYVQYRQRTGFKCGIIPYRKHQVPKFKTSDESLVLSDSITQTTSTTLSKNYPLIENIGAMNSLVTPSETIEVDLFAFSSEITRKSLHRNVKKSTVQTV